MFSRRLAATSLACLALTSLVGVMGGLSEASVPPTQPRLSVENIEAVTDGDLIFRRGRDTVSSAVVNASEAGAKYSHVGVIRRQGNDLFVIHAMPNEGNHPGGVFEEPLSAFIGTEVSLYARIVPVAGHPRERKQVIAYLKNQIGKPFDGAMSMSTEDAFYCTELPVKGWAQAGRPLKVEGTRFFMKQEDIITPESLLNAAIASAT